MLGSWEFQAELAAAQLSAIGKVNPSGFATSLVQTGDDAGEIEPQPGAAGVEVDALQCAIALSEQEVWEAGAVIFNPDSDAGGAGIVVGFDAEANSAFGVIECVVQCLNYDAKDQFVIEPAVKIIRAVAIEFDAFRVGQRFCTRQCLLCEVVQRLVLRVEWVECLIDFIQREELNQMVVDTLRFIQRLGGFSAHRGVGGGVRSALGKRVLEVRGHHAERVFHVVDGRQQEGGDVQFVCGHGVRVASRPELSVR